jgi:nitrate/nitrite-specific signal transduction histidine kinase
MRERAELLQGSLDLLHPNGNGTLVRLTVPIKEDKQESSEEKQESDAR